MAELPTLGFIGAGRTARAIAPALEAAGCRVAAVASRTHGSAERLAGLLDRCKATTAQEVAGLADLVFITTSDSVIAQVVEQVAWRPGHAVVHCSGALTLDALGPARHTGARVGSWHPVQTFADDIEADVLRGVIIGVEADEPLYGVLSDLAHRVGGTPMEVPPAVRPLYHAAAVMACGYVTTLLHEAALLWESAGLSPEHATSGLGKLAETTVANVRRQGARAALTGPAARGDVATVRLHLQALSAAAPQTLSLYRALAQRSVALAGGDANWNALLMSSTEEV